MWLLRWIHRLIQPVRRAFYTAVVRHMACACGKKLRVNGWSTVGPNTHLGDNVNFNGMEIAGVGKVTIGNNFHSGPGCLMVAQSHNYDQGDAIPYDHRIIPLDITIEDNVWLGSRVIILGGVRIGEGAIIQAGSCVVSDIPRCAIAGGHPAKVFKTRDVEHYEKLKAAGRFL